MRDKIAELLKNRHKCGESGFKFTKEGMVYFKSIADAILELKHPTEKVEMNCPIYLDQGDDYRGGCLAGSQGQCDDLCNENFLIERSATLKDLISQID